jgi:hypothetical protein
VPPLAVPPLAVPPLAVPPLAVHLGAATRVTLGGDAKAFTGALDRYIQQTKPDPLQQRQIKDWALEWVDDDSDSDHTNIPGSAAAAAVDDADADADLLLGLPSFASSFRPTHVLSGRLTIRGKYVAVTLHSLCWWKDNTNSVCIDGCDTQNTAQDGMSSSLFYQCHATAEIVSMKHDTSDDNNTDTTTTDHDKRVHQNMIQRLSADDYIAKLLPVVQAKDRDNSSSCIMAQPTPATAPERRRQRFLLLCQAHIAQSRSDLEERVYCNQDVAEGVRRAVFSRADTTLDLLDLLWHFPALPTTTNNNNNNNNNNNGTTAATMVLPDPCTTPTTNAPPTTTASSMEQDGNHDSFPATTTTTKLANRAKLRLLEEAMCHACEEQGEDDLVHELKVCDDGSAVASRNSNNNNPVVSLSRSKKKKRQR